MQILWDKDLEQPEVEISDSSSGLCDLGNLFLNVNSNRKILGEQKTCEYYSGSLHKIEIFYLQKCFENDRHDRLKIFVENQKNLVMKGNKLAFRKLGTSIVNFFDEQSQPGEHFHLSYLERDILLAPTNCHLIFVCR